MVNCPSLHTVCHMDFLKELYKRERIKQKLYHMAFSKNLKKKNLKTLLYTQKGKTGLLLKII